MDPCHGKIKLLITFKCSRSSIFNCHFYLSGMTSDMTSDLMLPLLKHAVQQHACIFLLNVVSKSEVEVGLEETLDTSSFV